MSQVVKRDNFMSGENTDNSMKGYFPPPVGMKAKGLRPVAVNGGDGAS